MGGPPDDRDGVDDVLDQVEQALDQLRLGDGEARDALMEGVREALSELGLGGAGAPDIRVMDGGRGEDDPTSEAPTPDLRVAGEGVAGEGATSSARVKVVRVGAASGATHHDGRIAVSGVDVWQTVSRSADPRAYRLWCEHGDLRVAIDGLPADTVGGGQSLDVEARLIRVCSVDGAEATGRYVRLRSD